MGTPNEKALWRGLIAVAISDDKLRTGKDMLVSERAMYTLPSGCSAILHKACRAR